MYSLRRHEEAEDVTQDVLIKLWQNLDTVEPDRVGAWIMRVARNAVIDVARRRKTRLGIIAEDVDVDIAANYAPAPNAGTELGVERRELRESIESALEKLEEPYRTIIVMREIQQLKYSEIVDAVDMPLNTVKVYLHRGRKMLRDLLKPGYQRDVI